MIDFKSEIFIEFRASFVGETSLENSLKLSISMEIKYFFREINFQESYSLHGISTDK